MSDVKLKFESAVVCDDIRMEFTGKAILIGVYPTDIVVPRFPSQFAVAIFCTGEVLEGGKIVAPFLIKDESGGLLFKAEDLVPGQTADFKPGPFAMQSSGFVTVNKESTLSFCFVVGGEEHTVMKKRVVLAPPVPPS